MTIEVPTTGLRIGQGFPPFADGFQISIDTTILPGPGSTNVTTASQLRLPFYPLLPLSLRVQWGDGSFDDITCDILSAPVSVLSSQVPGSSTTFGTTIPTNVFALVPFALHTYAVPGIYTITLTENIVGGMPAPVCFTDPNQGLTVRATDALKVLALKRWSGIPFLRYTNAFQGCSNLTLLDTEDDADADWSVCTHFGSAFERTGITSFPSFAFPAATNINFMFFDAINLVTAPALVLSPGCTMNSTFRRCTSLVSFPAMDLSGVISATRLCFDCYALVNGPTSPAPAVINFNNAFDNCPLLKSSFANLSPTAMTSAVNFAMNSDLNDPDSSLCVNCTNYNTLLVAWTGWSAGAPGPAGLALQPGVVIHFGVSKYDSIDAIAARAWLIGTKGWAITDGGFCCPAVANTVAPVISGLLPAGSLLSTTNGTWTGSPVAFTYQWRRNGGALGGATASTYTTVAGDVGQSITCTVTATSACGSFAAQASNALVPTSGALPGCANCNGVQTSGVIVTGPAPGCLPPNDPRHTYCFQSFQAAPACKWHYAFDANTWADIDFGIERVGEYTIRIRTAGYDWTTNAPGYYNPAIQCIGGQLTLAGIVQLKSTGGCADMQMTIGAVSPCLAPCTYCSGSQPSLVVAGVVAVCQADANGTYTYTGFTPGATCVWRWTNLAAGVLTYVDVSYNGAAWVTTLTVGGFSGGDNVSALSCNGAGHIAGVATQLGICGSGVGAITATFGP